MEQIGKYKVLANIGHGAIGSVEKAEAPDGTIVAIKTLFPQFVYEEEYVKRFKREAALAKKLSHPNVVKIFEVGEDQDGRCQYMVMEYIDGKSLAEYMHDKGMASAVVECSGKMNKKAEPDSKNKIPGKELPTKITTFTAKETIKIIRQLAGVLQAMADIGLLHRDIKPQNILLDKKGNAKLLDFGLVKDTEALVSMLSTTGQSIGTPPYMSPEQHEDSKETDMRSDLYSLGCIAYHMLTGRPPFPGPTASAFARQHSDDIPEPVHKMNPDCPLNLSQVIDRLLAKKPENRHKNPDELIEDLNRVECGEVPLKLYKPKKSKKHNPLRNWLTVAAAAVIVAGCFTGWNFYKRGSATVITKVVWERQKEATEFTRSESSRKRKLQSSLEAYNKTLVMSLALDLSAVPNAGYPSLHGLAPGSRAAQTLQKAWVSKLGLPLEVQTKKVGIKLRLIPPGTFIMGSPSGENKRCSDEKQHRVTLTKPFYMDKYEVTQGEWKRVMGGNPSNFRNIGDNAPVEQVSWDDCQKFLSRLCALEKVPRGTYRLLTEAQWEYACRAGTDTPFYCGNSLDASMANFDGDHPYMVAKRIDRKTRPVGSFKANAWGLYDMHGNVWEWCNDWYGSYGSRVFDPAGASSGSDRVYRGGCWNDYAGYCRSANRNRFRPLFRDFLLGFRLLRIVPVKNKR